MRWALVLLLCGCGVAGSSKVTVRARGLCSATNLMGTPDGGLVQAENVTISKDNVIETRRAFNTVATKALTRIFPFKDALVGHGGTTLSRSSDGATWVDYAGTFTKPSDAPVRVAEASGDLFLTSADGVVRLDAYAGTPEAAGVPQAPDIFLLGDATGTSLDAHSAVAYRVVFGKKDANDRVMLGAPSGRSERAWDGAAATATNVTVQAPPGLTASNFVQIYRSPNSGGYTIAPSDEMQLAFEAAWPTVTAKVTSIQRTTNLVTVTLDGAHGLAANDRVYLDPGVAGFPAGVRFVASPTSTTFNYSEIAANAGPSAVASASVERLTYTVLDNIPDALLQAALYSNETQEGIGQTNSQPPVARDVAMFRNSLFVADTEHAPSQIVHLIAVKSSGASAGFSGSDTLTVNGVAYSFSTLSISTMTGTPQENVRAVALSMVRQINQTRPAVAQAWYVSGADDPAGMILIAGMPGDSSLTISTTCPSAFLPSSLGATAERMQNAVAWSKTLQPDAVPLLNYTRVGSADRAILRIIPTRDSLFILKDEEGTWRLTGDSPATFRVDPFDLNCNIAAPETARALDNKIFALTTQGVVAITDTGVELVSRSSDGRGIEDILRPLLVGAMAPVTKSVAFAVTSESDRKYILFLPTLATDTIATQAYVYDLITQAWTKWDVSAAHGVSNPADDCLYLVDGAHVFKESKTFSAADFLEDAAQITETVEWVPAFGQPGMMHHFREVTLSLRSAAFTGAKLSFATDLDPAWEDVDLPAVTSRDYATVRVLVPRDKARGSLLRIRWTKQTATAQTQIQAITVGYTPGDVPVVIP